MRPTVFLPFFALAAIPTLAAAQRRDRDRPSNPQEWLDDCRRGGGWGDDERVCDVQEKTIAVPAGGVRIDGGPNGGVTVTGWDRNEVKIVAKLSAQARSKGDADEMLKEIRILTDGSIRAEGPRSRGRGGWGVSFDVMVPRASNVNAETTNGGVVARQVSGRLNLSTTNGGVTLDEVAGDVHAETVNGGVNVRLAGDHWEGQGLEVRATNGGVRLQVPEGYNARLEAETTNGGLQTDFPVTLQGRIDRHISTTLGRGGALISARTTNGGVRINRL